MGLNKTQHYTSDTCNKNLSVDIPFKLCLGTHRICLDLPDPEEDHVEGEEAGQRELQHSPQEVVGVEAVAVLYINQFVVL